MAYAYARKDTRSLRGEITSTAVMIENIPPDWTIDHMLHMMDQRKLPSPTDLKYLYDDNLYTFRGMAFAHYSSSDEAWRVIQNLNDHLVSGRRLKVQHQRDWPQLTSREHLDSERHFQAQPTPRSDVSDQAYLRPQAKASLAARRTREQTPPSESYDLLMSYQTNPVETEKLRHFLVQTGNYQEAVNEFAKNRVREAQAGKFKWFTEWFTEEGTMLEKRPPTPGEQMQIDEMEAQCGIGCRAASSGSPMVKHRGELGVRNRTEERVLQITAMDSVGAKDERAPAKQGGSPEDRHGQKDLERG